MTTSTEIQRPPAIGTFLIPDERFLYCLRVDRVREERLGQYRIGCTRCDLSKDRKPVMERMDPLFAVDIKSDGLGGWISTEKHYDEPPTTYREYGQLQLF
jgi:hypothetical protein